MFIYNRVYVCIKVCHINTKMIHCNIPARAQGQAKDPRDFATPWKWFRRRANQTLQAFQVALKPLLKICRVALPILWMNCACIDLYMYFVCFVPLFNTMRCTLQWQTDTFCISALWVEAFQLQKYMYVYAHNCIYMHTYIFIYIYTYIYIYIYTYMNTYIYTCIYIHTHIHINTHIYTDTYMHMHTNMNAYMHIRVYPQEPQRNTKQTWVPWPWRATAHQKATVVRPANCRRDPQCQFACQTSRSQSCVPLLQQWIARPLIHSTNVTLRWHPRRCGCRALKHLRAHVH